MISEENYSNLASAMSFDMDNDSIYSMTSSKHDGMDDEGILKSGDDDEDDYIPASLSDFIANADKMFEDLVNDLDLPSSRNGSRDGSFDNDESKENKAKLKGATQFEAVTNTNTNTNTTPKDNCAGDKNEEVKSIAGKSLPMDVIENSDMDELHQEEKQFNQKVDFLSPGSEMASPSEPNFAENFDTVRKAQRKALSPETPGLLKNSSKEGIFNLKEDMESEMEAKKDETHESLVGTTNTKGPTIDPAEENNDFDNDMDSSELDDEFLPNRITVNSVVEDPDDEFVFPANENPVSPNSFATDTTSSDDEQFFPNRDNIFSSLIPNPSKSKPVAKKKETKSTTLPAKTTNTQATKTRSQPAPLASKSDTKNRNPTVRSTLRKKPVNSSTSSTSLPTKTKSAVSSMTSSRKLRAVAPSPISTTKNTTTKRPNVKPTNNTISNRSFAFEKVKYKMHSIKDKMKKTSRDSKTADTDSVNHDTVNANVVVKPQKCTRKTSTTASSISLDVTGVEKADDYETCNTSTTAENTMSSVTSGESGGDTTMESVKERKKTQTVRNHGHPSSVKETKRAPTTSKLEHLKKNMQKHAERLKAAREKRASIGSSYETPKRKPTKERKERSSSISRRGSAPPPIPSSRSSHSSSVSSKPKNTLYKGRDGSDPMHENPITSSWGSPTHGPHRPPLVSSSEPRTLTTPVEPNLTTRKRHGEKNYSTSSMASTGGDTSTLESNMSMDGSKEKSEHLTFGESLNFVERKGFGEMPTEAIKWDPSRGVTVPVTPKLSTSKSKQIKSQAQLEEEMMEQANINPFKARPVPNYLKDSKGARGLPKVPPAKSTTPKPFRLTERLGNSTSSSVNSETVGSTESVKPFQARPMPDLKYRPPKVPNAEKRELTTPKPFRLSADLHDPNDSVKPMTTEELLAAECANQFKALPIPSSIRTPQSFNVTARPLTTPKPFHLTNIPKDKRVPTTEELEVAECANQFKARALPSCNSSPLTYVRPTQPRELTTPKPFSLHTDARISSLPKPRTTEEIMAEECEKQFQAKPMPNLSYKPPHTNIERKCITSPAPFTFDSREKGFTSQPVSADDVELSKKFQATPIPSLTFHPPRLTVNEQKKITTPSPFRLCTEARFGNGTPKSPSSQDIDAIECAKQFQARPMPDLSYQPPKSSIKARDLTEPKPFNLLGYQRHHLSSPSTDDIELAKKFHARSMPNFSYKGITSKSSTTDPSLTSKQSDNRKSSITAAKRNVIARMKEKRRNRLSATIAQITVPTPFSLNTDSRHESHQAKLQRRLKREEERENRLRNYKAEPSPDFRKQKVFTPNRSSKELTEPVPFELLGTPRHEAAQYYIREMKRNEEEELKRLSIFTATPLPKSKTPFMPKLDHSSRKPLRSIDRNFQTQARAQDRNEYEKKLMERKKHEMAMKKLREEEMARREEEEMKELRRKPVSEGGLCFKAKPINFIFKDRAQKARATIAF